MDDKTVATAADLRTTAEHERRRGINLAGFDPILGAKFSDRAARVAALADQIDVLRDVLKGCRAHVIPGLPHGWCGMRDGCGRILCRDCGFKRDVINEALTGISISENSPNGR